MSRFAPFCHLPCPERSRTLNLQLSYILRRLLPSWVAWEGAHFCPGEGVESRDAPPERGSGGGDLPPVIPSPPNGGKVS